MTRQEARDLEALLNAMPGAVPNTVYHQLRLRGDTSPASLIALVRVEDLPGGYVGEAWITAYFTGEGCMRLAAKVLQAKADLRTLKVKVHHPDDPGNGPWEILVGK